MSTETALRPLTSEHRTSESADKSMRARQLVSTVRQGRKIIIGIGSDGDGIVQEGYLAGWDDETYFLVAENEHQNGIVKLLIPKSAIAYIELVDERTFREEPFYETMNNVVKPFRDYINNTYFPQQSRD